MLYLCIAQFFLMQMHVKKKKRIVTEIILYHAAQTSSFLRKF